MKRLRLKIFILVAEIESRLVQKVVEGVSERNISGVRLEEFDAMMFQKVNALSRLYPPQVYDVMLTRAQSFDDLKTGYPEFSGWEKIQIEKINAI